MSYYAVLSLDVDGMGQWLDGRHARALTRADFLPSIDDPSKKREITPALHREVSRRQSQLASGPIYEIIEQRHLGRVIYSGGDDVFAFVPLACVWRCLDDLRRRFCDDVEGLGDKVTLSAGVAITHWRTPLSHALKLAREAEGNAKDEGRDRLVITVDPRSGERIVHSAKWSLAEQLRDLRVLADPYEDHKTREEEDDDDDAAQTPLKIRLGTLEALEREIETLQAFTTANSGEAIRARAALHLTGTRWSSIQRHRAATSPLLAHLLTLATASEPAPLVHLLHLLRFLVREHDPALAALIRPKEAT
jgi:CRISPR/Cas system-associated protein Cas10 (large subunit of type III CRISPR-Cas system)